MSSDRELAITLRSERASDSRGFVGVVDVGTREAYRTIRAHPSPSDGLHAAQHLLADLLGGLMAGQEWQAAQSEFGHAPRRTEFQFGLAARSRALHDVDVTADDS